MASITLTIDITVRLIQSVGGDHMVVAAARVSTDPEKALANASLPAEENFGLINYLMKFKHGSPFEHGLQTFFVHAPIFVFREWHRHRVGFSYNEESARYRPLEPVFWIPRRDRLMVPVEGWKPGKPKFRSLDDLYTHGPPEWVKAQADSAYAAQVDRMQTAYEVSYNLYQDSIKAEIALEVARAVLPVGIYSSCWVSCNPRSLMHFMSLRTHDEEAKFVSYPQMEIEEAARVCERMLADGWPLTYKAFCQNGIVAP